MSEEVRWEMLDHTRAKHRVLRCYLDQWIPIMGQQALKVRTMTGEKQRLLLADGFAGPGRYVDGEPGSPLIMLDALQSHSAFFRLGEVEFHFLFIEQNRKRYEALGTELGDMGKFPSNVKVQLVHGHFEDQFGDLVDTISEKGKHIIPTFAFVDPFGYSDAPMSLAGRFLDFPRTEALFFLPLSHLARFVSRDGQESAFTALFGSDRWRDAIPLSGADRSAFLMDLFEEQLLNQGQVSHVTSFKLRTGDGKDYRLVFATGHPKGRDAMKNAMWKVDPVNGTTYQVRMQTGQEVLFGSEPDTGPLLAELKATFEGRWFTIEEAAEATDQTPAFLSGSHLKRRTLAPAEKAKILEVKRPDGCQKNAFTTGVRMRFQGR